METIETINQRLIDHFGVDTATGQPLFRVVWADDQVEKRLMHTLDSGIELLYPTVREVKKYNYLSGVHVLEHLVVVPEFQRAELADVKLSYEPVWSYKDEHGKPLPPLWEPTKFIVDTLYAALGKKSLANYIAPEESQETRVDRLVDELFGNESETTDALTYKEGIVVPNNYGKVN